MNPIKVRKGEDRAKRLKLEEHAFFPPQKHPSHTIGGLKAVLKQATQRNWELRGELRYVLQHVKKLRNDADSILKQYEHLRWTGARIDGRKNIILPKPRPDRYVQDCRRNASRIRRNIKDCKKIATSTRQTIEETK